MTIITDISAMPNDEKNIVFSSKEITPEDALKEKKYRVKILDWHCPDCDIYCNSVSQFDVHMISQKHRFVIDEGKRKIEKKDEIEKISALTENEFSNDESDDLENDEDTTLPTESLENMRSKPNFSITEIEQNPVAIRFNINAVKYLITEDKKKGKFEKFGFYCKTCDAYMTGQIQLIMHVRGAKHQYFHPNEIPNYKPTKNYNPFHQKKRSVNVNGTFNGSNKENFFINKEQNFYQNHQTEFNNNNLPRNKQIIDQIMNYQGQMKNNQVSYGTGFSYTGQNSGQTSHKQVLVNDQNQLQYNLQEQVHQLAYNFKIHPVYAYQIILNQRLNKQNGPHGDQNLNDDMCGKVPVNQNFNDMSHQRSNEHSFNMQYNNQYEQYMQQQQQQFNQQNIINSQGYANNVNSTPNQYSTPPNGQYSGQLPQKNTNYQHHMKFNQNQSPIPYNLPQNSTPPSSFNQTPILINNNGTTPKKNLLENNENKVFTNTFNSFNTPQTANFNYYPNNNSNNMHGPQ